MLGATTLRRRRDEWIEIGVMEALEKLAREAYDRAIGLDLFDVWPSIAAPPRLRVGERRREKAR